MFGLALALCSVTFEDTSLCCDTVFILFYFFVASGTKIVPLASSANKRTTAHSTYHTLAY